MKRWLDRFTPYLKHYKAALIWAAFLLFISLIPGNELPKISFWNWNITDKIAHVGVYFVMAILLIYGSWKHSGFARRPWVYLLIFPGISIVYGLAMECFQLWFTTTRHASAGDVLANSLGAIMGTVLAYFILKPRSR